MIFYTSDSRLASIDIIYFNVHKVFFIFLNLIYYLFLR